MTKICIDAFNISRSKGSGIATYGHNLLKNINDLGHRSQVLYGPSEGRESNNIVNETALIKTSSDAPRVKKSKRFFNTFSCRFGRTVKPVMPSDQVIWPNKSGGRPEVELFWSSEYLFYYANRSFDAYNYHTPISFSNEITDSVPDIMHWTTVMPLHAKSMPNIYTIHDLIPLKLPHTTLDNTRNFMLLCQHVAKRADRIATVSETSKADIIRILGVDEHRITTTYQSVEIPASVTQKSNDDVIMELDGIFGLDWKSYYLHFATVEPKKNLGRIVEAFLSSGSNRKLVIVGGSGWLQESELALIRQVKLQGGKSAEKIIQFDYLPYSILMTLVRGARATVFPSLYEGFGLPVLESMALGTAVITSNISSLAEVAGEAAYLVDPYDVAAISKGFRVMDADTDLLKNLEDMGLIQSSLFSENAYREKLKTLYEAVS